MKQLLIALTLISVPVFGAETINCKEYNKAYEESATTLDKQLLIKKVEDKNVRKEFFVKVRDLKLENGKVSIFASGCKGLNLEFTGKFNNPISDFSNVKKGDYISIQFFGSSVGIGKDTLEDLKIGHLAIILIGKNKAKFLKEKGIFEAIKDDNGEDVIYVEKD